MPDHEREQRRRQARATTFRQRLLWLDGALRLVRALQRGRRRQQPPTDPR